MVIVYFRAKNITGGGLLDSRLETRTAEISATQSFPVSATDSETDPSDAK